MQISKIGVEPQYKSVAKNNEPSFGMQWVGAEDAFSKTITNVKSLGNIKMSTVNPFKYIATMLNRNGIQLLNDVKAMSKNSTLLPQREIEVTNFFAGYKGKGIASSVETLTTDGAKKMFEGAKTFSLSPDNVHLIMTVKDVQSGALVSKLLTLNSRPEETVDLFKNDLALIEKYMEHFGGVLKEGSSVII